MGWLLFRQQFLAPAAFCAALAIGLVALLVEQRFNVPRMAIIVAPIAIMMPAVYAYEMIVLFNRESSMSSMRPQRAVL